MISLFKRKCKNNVKVDLIYTYDEYNQLTELKTNKISIYTYEYDAEGDRISHKAATKDRFELESIDIEYGLQGLFNHKNQYIILTSPDIQNNIRFVQACMINNSVEVQILYQDTTPQLLYKLEVKYF